MISKFSRYITPAPKKTESKTHMFSQTHNSPNPAMSKPLRCLKQKRMFSYVLKSRIKTQGPRSKAQDSGSRVQGKGSRLHVSSVQAPRAQGPGSKLRNPKAYCLRPRIHINYVAYLRKFLNKNHDVSRGAQPHGEHIFKNQIRKPLHF